MDNVEYNLNTLSLIIDKIIDDVNKGDYDNARYEYDMIEIALKNTHEALNERINEIEND